MDILESIRGRRSIKFFDPARKVPVGKLLEIIETANLAPSSYNLQPWEVILVVDDKSKKLLREVAFNQAKVEEAAAVLIVIANPNAVEENIDMVLKSWVDLGYSSSEDAEKGRNFPFKHYGERDSERRRIFAVKNSALFAMNVMIAARGYGLETHPMDGFQDEEVKKRFGVPGDRIVPLLIAVGYPLEDIDLLPRAVRRKTEDFVRLNHFKGAQV